MNTELTDLNFRVANLGSVRTGEFTQKPLTIFCGPNNTGKTWVLYSLYHFYHRLELHKVAGGDLGDLTLDEFNRSMSATLPFFFNAPEAQIAGAEFAFADEGGRLPDFDRLDKAHVFLMPAERSGLHLFFRELATRRTALLHHASRDNIDIGALLRDVIFSRYAMPIADYIDWLNLLTENQKSKSKWGHPHAEQIKRGLAGGTYRVDARTGAIEFQPYKKKGDVQRAEPLDLHITSSTVKSLFGLWFYLEHQAQEGDILMIDEPELNLHPANQRKIARLLAQLVNSKINVVISTHSDYIIREFNSLIMLKKDKSGELRQKHRYADDEILSKKQVGAYLFDKGTIKPSQVVPTDGIYADTFDEVIVDLNDVNNDIYYGVKRQSNV